MCGIGAVLCPADNDATGIWVRTIGAALSPRGPDHSGSVQVHPGQHVTAHLLASVLHLRGHSMRCQPAIDEDGNVLCWNGEVFGCRAAPTATDGPAFQVPAGQSDTEVVLEQLACAPAGEEYTNHLRAVLATIEGPYAFIYYRADVGCLYYGRDPLGRRSLLLTQDPASGSVIMTSVAFAGVPTSLTWREVDVRGFYCRTGIGEDVQEQLVPWHSWQVSFLRYAALASQPSSTQLESSDQQQHSMNTGYDTIEAAAHGLLQVLDAAVGRRVANIETASPAPETCDGAGPARVAVLFSGGIDSMVVACLTHRHVPPHEPIDLINVCFDRDAPSPDRLGAIAGRRELQTRHPDRVWRLLLVDLDYDEVMRNDDRIKQLIKPSATPMDFNIACAFWFASRGVGVIFQENTHPIFQDRKAEQAALDMGLLRYATHGNSHRRKDDGAGVSSGEDREEAHFDGRGGAAVADNEEGKVPCPEPRCRRTVKKGCAYGVCRQCCLARQRHEQEKQGDGTAEGRRCRVHKHKVNKMKKKQGLEGQHAPADKEEVPWSYADGQFQPDVQDDALGGREDNGDGSDIAPVEEEAVGMTSPPSGGQPPPAVAGVPEEEGDSLAAHLYRSCARVLLLGVGADEQMGGYGRHRAAFEKRGFAGLETEMALDMGRLWTRNLGRDDRCVSDHGRESRLPFLDEQVVAFLQALPLHLKCDMREPLGVGDKKILREVAGRLLGLPSCARLVKRAIQFGTRIARAANVHHFGSHRAGKGQRWRNGNKWTLMAEGGELEEEV